MTRRKIVLLLPGRRERCWAAAPLLLLCVLAHVILSLAGFAPAGEPCSADPDAINSIELPAEEHPYGRVMSAVPVWENDAAFRQQLARCGAKLRMAAFQTTLPDPLPGEEENITIAAARLAGTVVPPGAVFSMNRTLGPYTQERGFKSGPTYFGSRLGTTTGGGVCKVATTLYNLAVLANLPIVERHSHGMLVPYVPPGQDATVVYGVRDFRFRNNTASPLLIWSQSLDGTLYAAFYGTETPPKITWQHELLSRSPPPTLYRYNRALPPGETRVVSPGADSVVVRSWIVIETADGEVQIKEMGVDRYRPMPRIVERR